VSGIDGKIASKTDGSSAELQVCFAEISPMLDSTGPSDTTLPYKKECAVSKLGSPTALQPI
jgi:hypothetical protein